MREIYKADQFKWRQKFPAEKPALFREHTTEESAYFQLSFKYTQADERVIASIPLPYIGLQLGEVAEVQTFCGL